MFENGPAPASPPRSRPLARSDRARLVRMFLLLVAAVIAVDALVGERGLLAAVRARRQYDELAAAIERQRTVNAELQEEIRRLTEDQGAIEEIARRELGLIRPGEKVFVIKDRTAPPRP